MRAGRNGRSMPRWWAPVDGDAASLLAARQQPESAGDQRWMRAVHVDAPPTVVYDWMTQLRRAPYSYDWLDNFGHRSPRRLDTRAGEIAAGDEVMTIFTTVSVVPGRSFTVRLTDPRWTAVCGRIDVTYEALPHARGTLLSAELIVSPAPGPLPRLRRAALAWGDLLMMRKQLGTLAALAERDERSMSARLR